MSLRMDELGRLLSLSYQELLHAYWLLLLGIDHTIEIDLYPLRQTLDCTEY